LATAAAAGLRNKLPPRLPPPIGRHDELAVLHLR